MLANNPHLAYSNQAYKGYAIVEARSDAIQVTYRAVRNARSPTSDVFTLRRFHVDSGRPVVVDDGGPVPLPGPGSAGPIEPALAPAPYALGQPG